MARAKTKVKYTNHNSIYIYLGDSLHMKLKLHALLQKRSMSDVIREIVQKWVDEQEQVQESNK